MRAILPDGFISPRPVLRINAEIREEKEGYAEFNIAVEKDGKTGWLNISCWNDIKFKKSGRITVFENENLNIAFTGVGIEGSCPAEKGSAGCYFIKGGEIELVPPEKITGRKEFCDCSFRVVLGKWRRLTRRKHGKNISGGTGRGKKCLPETGVFFKKCSGNTVRESTWKL